MQKSLAGMFLIFAPLSFLGCNDGADFQSQQKAVVAATEADEEARLDSLELTVNNQTQNALVELGSTATIEWESRGFLKCDLKVGEDILSSERSGEIDKKNIEASFLVDLTCDEKTKKVRVVVGKAGHQVQYEAYTTRKKDQTGLLDPVTLYFTLDITNSMGEVLALIRDQIGDFVENLKQENIEISLGLTVFRDVVESSSYYGDDIAGFRSALEGFIAQGGGEIPEASLKGLQSAATSIDEIEEKAEAIRTMVLITDSWGHASGSTFTYDCALDETIASLQGFYDKNPGKWQFLYSSRNAEQVAEQLAEITPSTSMTSCLNAWPSPVEQYEALSRALAPQEDPQSFAMPWPFSRKSMHEILTRRISEAVNNTKQSCFAKEVEMRRGEEVLERWELEVKDVWENRDYPTVVPLDENIKVEDVKIFTKSCCMATADAKDGKFELCVDDGEFKGL